MTHVLQAADQVFSPVKKEMEIQTHLWHGENAGKKLDQYGLMKFVAYQAFEKVFSRKETVRNAFRKTGIFPWNKIQPDIRKLKAGSIYKRNFVHEDVFPFPPGSDSLPATTVSTNANAPPATATSVSMAAAVPPATTASASTVPASDFPDSLESAPTSDEVVGDAAVELSMPVSAPCPVPSSSSSLSLAVMSRESSTSSTATLPTGSSSTEEFLLNEQRNLSLRQKKKQLDRIEAFLDDRHQDMFDELFAKRNFDFPHAEYQSWLVLKLQAVGTEDEALQRVLSSRIPQNLQKKKSTRTSDMPTGDARYAPQSGPFYDYYSRCEERRKEKEKKGKRKVSCSTTTPTTTTDTDSSPPVLISKPPAKRQRKTGPKT